MLNIAIHSVARENKLIVITNNKWRSEWQTQAIRKKNKKKKETYQPSNLGYIFVIRCNQFVALSDRVMQIERLSYSVLSNTVPLNVRFK